MRCAKAEFEEADWLEVVRTSEAAKQAHENGKLYAFLAVEGMESIGADLSGIDRYAEFGARV